MKTNMDEKSANRPWQKTKHANLVRNVSPGKYFARFRSNGKLFWRSLETDVLSTAAQRLTSAAEPYNASGKHEAHMAGSNCCPDFAATAGHSAYASRMGNRMETSFRSFFGKRVPSSRLPAQGDRRPLPPFPVSKPCPTGDRILSKSCPKRI